MWAKQAGGRSYDRAESASVNDRGEVLVTGYFTHRATFGMDEPNETEIFADDQISNENDIFLAKFKP
jgi:hypothetical protein